MKTDAVDKYLQRLPQHVGKGCEMVSFLHSRLEIAITCTILKSYNAVEFDVFGKSNLLIESWIPWNIQSVDGAT